MCRHEPVQMCSELDLSLLTKGLEATMTISRYRQAITLLSNKNKDHPLPKEADLQRAIVDTTITQDWGKGKLTPTKNVMIQLT